MKDRFTSIFVTTVFLAGVIFACECLFVRPEPLYHAATEAPVPRPIISRELASPAVERTPERVEAAELSAFEPREDEQKSEPRGESAEVVASSLEPQLSPGVSARKAPAKGNSAIPYVDPRVFKTKLNPVLSRPKQNPENNWAAIEVPESSPAVWEITGKRGSFGKKSKIIATANVEFFRLDAQDVHTRGNATFVSDLSRRVGLAWQREWIESLHSELAFNIRQEKMMDIDSTTRSMVGGSGNTVAFAARIHKDWSEESRSFIELARQQQIFVRSSSSANVIFDRVWIGKVGIGHEQNLLRLGRFSAGVGASAAYLMARKGAFYEIREGWEAKAAPFLDHRWRDFGIRATPFYLYQKQNTSIAGQSKAALGILLGLDWSFE